MTEPLQPTHVFLPLNVTRPRMPHLVCLADAEAARRIQTELTDRGYKLATTRAGKVVYRLKKRDTFRQVSQDGVACQHRSGLECPVACFILGLPRTAKIGYLNQDPLDLRRENLIVLTTSADPRDRTHEQQLGPGSVIRNQPGYDQAIRDRTQNLSRLSVRGPSALHCIEDRDLRDFLLRFAHCDDPEHPDHFWSREPLKSLPEILEAQYSVRRPSYMQVYLWLRGRSRKFPDMGPVYDRIRRRLNIPVSSR